MKKNIPPKDRKHENVTAHINELMKDPDIRKEYDRLQPEFAIIDLMYEARQKKKMSQKKLAERIGTKQSVISRLESGNANPSIKFLQKFAEALDTTLQIKFVENP